MVWFNDLVSASLVIIGTVLNAMSFVVVFADGLGRCAVDGLGRCGLMLHLALFTSVVLEFLLLVDVLMT